MSVFSNTDIERFITQGEIRFCTENPCIIDRYSMAIVSGTASYELPSYALGIRRVTWLGMRVDPESHRGLRQTGLSGTQSGRPYSYIYNNVGKQKIQFFPVPNEALSAITGTSLWGSGIDDGVVIEFYRTPDSTGTTYRLPLYLRRQFLKNFVMMKCFNKEGQGQNLKAAKYFSQKWEFEKSSLIEYFYDLVNKPRNLVNSGQVKDYRNPPFAHLPLDKFGISVDNEF